MRIRTLAGALCLLLPVTVLQAAPRAWLEPDQIALGETATLYVESDSTTDQAPDFAVLEGEFELGGQSSSTQMSFVNGRAESRSKFSVVLEPRAAGNFTIPSLTVGSGSTERMTLVVAPARPGSAQRDDLLYFEAELATHTPYVQQSVAYTVRLFYAVPLIDGSVDLPAPDTASLLQVGEDQTGQQNAAGRRYTVFTRHYLLTPEKSGALTLPAPRFRGRRQSDDNMGFFSRAVPVTQIGKSETLEVRALPATAPTPWLIANQLTLTRGTISRDVRAGESLLLDLTLVADGTTAAQLPELTLPGVPGAQVFPELAQSKDTIVDGRPRANVTRRFAIVPAAPGTLRLPEIRIDYWNANTDQVDVATVPALSVTVVPGVSIPSALPPLPSVTQASGEQRAPSRVTRGSKAPTGDPALAIWQAVSAGLSVTCALALWWGWRRGRGRTPPGWESPVPEVQVARDSSSTLRLALAGEDLRAIGAALRLTATPPSASLGALKARLDDPEQRAAVEALEQHLWAGGDETGSTTPEQTLGRLRGAFQHGPRFAPAQAPASEGVLPPLYPLRSPGDQLSKVSSR